jgi:two-component system, OmpR family, sensor histidine kinase QseC
MRSLQWRMLAALGLVIALAWGISIAMFVSYLTAGPSNAWISNLHSLGAVLVRVLPDEWAQTRRPQAETTQATTSHQQKKPAAPPTSPNPGSDPEGILIAMFLNTIELVIVGTLMWWAVVASLRPLRAMSEDIAVRKALDSTTLPIEKVPHELHPLILAFNSLLLRVDDAMRAERQFVADAAHELRTPLAALHMQGEVALHAQTLDRKDEALKKLLDVSRRTHRLADQLLDLARLDAGLHSTGPHETNLLELSRHVISEFSVQADNRHTRLLLSGTPCMVKCDVDEMGILIRNLVDNAIRHGREFGTVDIFCGYRVRGDLRHPMLEVRDDGPGVAEEERHAIFSRFYRATGTQAQGSGIGLSLVAGIAALHEAIIETQTGEDGRGLRIRIIFPAERPGA